MKNIDRQNGITLVEVLVTVLVTSVGILGLLSLQALSIKMTHDSFLRTQATFLARDIADRLLTNPDGDYSITESQFLNLTTAPSQSCASSIQDTNCSIAEMRNFDIYNWSQSAKNVLPNARITITAPGVGELLHTITIKWNDQADDGSEQSLVYKAI